MPDPAVIVGLGARTSVGLDLPATDAAVRANLGAFTSCAWLRSRTTGEALPMARLSALPPGAPAADRMRQLGLAAAAEALQPLRRSAASGTAIPVVLALPPRRPGFPEGVARRLVADLIAALPCAVDRRLCLKVDTGHDAGLAALAIAARVALNPGVTACLVLGVESYMDVETIDWFDGHGRLKREDRPTGFLPAEGAGAVLVSRLGPAVKAGLTPLVSLVSAARDEEPSPWYSGEPTLGRGLTRALQESFDLASAVAPRADVTYCDMNGEAWRADEWAYAYLRTVPHHGEPLDLRAPASSWGDVGAATGPLLAAIAARELLRRPDPGTVALLWTMSDMKPYRAACLLRRLGGT